MNWTDKLFELLISFISGLASGIILFALELKFPQKQINEKHVVIERRYIKDESLSRIQEKEWKIFGFCSFILEIIFLIASYLYFYFTQSELSPFDMLTQSVKTVLWWNFGTLLVILFFYFKFRLFESNKKYLIFSISGTILTTIFAIVVSWNLHIQSILDAFLNNFFNALLFILLVLSLFPAVMVFFCFMYKDQVAAKKQLFIPNIVFILLVPFLYFAALFSLNR